MVGTANVCSLNVKNVHSWYEKSLLASVNFPLAVAMSVAKSQGNIINGERNVPR